MYKYKKYCPNVFVAECDDVHNKGDIIEIETKYGKINEHIVHNLVLEKNWKYYYSITRTDGFNSQERAKRKLEKYNELSSKSYSKSMAHLKRSNKDAEFLRLAEPIKVWHHSESRHRRMIENANKETTKMVEASKKAEDYMSKSEYRETQKNKIDLSMPESIEYYEHMYEKAKKYHFDMKTWLIPKTHSYSLTYAKKDVNTYKKNLEIAKKLRGNEDNV